MKAVDYLNAELFCSCKRITRNKHGVLFINNIPMMMDHLKLLIIETLPSDVVLTEADFKEAVSRIDLYAKPTKQSSPYFRKGRIKYGLFGKAKD